MNPFEHLTTGSLWGDPAVMRAELAASRPRECDPSFTLESHIASLRDADPVRWAELNAQWSAPIVQGDG